MLIISTDDIKAKGIANKKEVEIIAVCMLLFPNLQTLCIAARSCEKVQNAPYMFMGGGSVLGH